MTYGDIIADCFRFLGINDVEKVRRMKLNEYRAMLRGYRAKYVDDMESIHLLAWQTNLAGQTKANGNPVFDKFDKFFKRSDWEVEQKKPINHKAVAEWDVSIQKAEDLLNKRFDGFSQD